MIPEIGTFALVLALLVALVQGTLPLIGAQRGVAAWVALARPASATLFLLIAIAFGCLTAAFIGNDFSVLYVAQHSNSRLPLEYRIAGVWGGHEGSLLLWVLMLSLWGMAVAAFSRSLPDDMVARVEGVMGLVAAGFLLFILLTSSPIERAKNLAKLIIFGILMGSNNLIDDVKLLSQLLIIYLFQTILN